jgi:2-keto-3-deoxy-6-phosphogluconate aldolase
VAEILGGAGMVLTTDQVDWEVAAGARFIVAPGISSSSEIETGLERLCERISEW